MSGSFPVPKELLRKEMEKMKNRTIATGAILTSRRSLSRTNITSVTSISILIMVLGSVGVSASIYITDDTFGGDCTTVGIWDDLDDICTLTQDVSENITISGFNNVTLNCDSFSVDTSGQGGPTAVTDGISVSFATGVIVEYVVGNDKVHIFVITAKEIHAKSVKVRRIDLQAKVDLLRALLRRKEGAAWKKPARSLAKLLIDPLSENQWLKSVDNLRIVPHGVLNYLPFAVLLHGDNSQQQFLVTNYTISYLPAAATLLQTPASANSETSILALAPESAQLQYAIREVNSIGDMFPDTNRVLTGKQASEAEFKRVAPDYQILHLATHGRFNRINPLLSGLELESGAGEDGNLQVYEIFMLKLDAALVTLSACNTALASGHFNDVPPGDEFVGLTRAFLHAGSESVFASLWEVNDRSTLEFMVKFYDKFSTEQRKDESVAKVQRLLAGSGGPYSHPYYWAPYILVGSTDNPAKIYGK
jgi:CHAT domain-containing protein